MVSSVDVFAPVTDIDYSEEGYLAANPDVRNAVKDGVFTSGFQHFERHGRAEGRLMALLGEVARLRRTKLARLKATLRQDLEHQRRSDIFDFLTAELRTASGLDGAAAPASSNEYDGFALALIEQFADGLVLDCGAGNRKTYYSNVINFEIAEYPSTDVLGVGEALPFKDDSIDAVLSLAVLEHVKDPFRCAAEIVRVLKPGGRLICAVPFLQPEHGYPHHYYNMAPQGLRALFTDRLVVDDHQVLASTHPVWTLSWIVQSWARCLPEDVREQFLNLHLGEFITDPLSLVTRPWATAMPKSAQFELASATVLFAHKPRGGA